MKKNKLFAPFLMLLAGAVVSIVMYIKRYDLQQMLTILIGVLVIFYLIGWLIQKKVWNFMKQIKEKEAEEKALEEGEVIEKELSGEKELSEEAEAGNADDEEGSSRKAE